MSKLFALLIVATIALSGCAMLQSIQPEEVVTEDFTDSGVGCIDDCLDTNEVKAI